MAIKKDNMKEIVKKVYSELFKVKKTESILILCDKKTKKLAEKFFEFGYEFGDHTLCLEIKEPKQNGEEPDLEVAKLMLQYNIILIITSKSLSHTNARKNASKKGAKIASMPGITKDMMKRCLEIDYKELNKRNKWIYNKLLKAKTVRITTKLGTDINFKIYNNKIIYETTMHKPGDFHNLPMGEVFVSPKEGTASGIYIVDGSQAGTGKVDSPIKITVEKGIATKICGANSARKLRNILAKVKDKGAYNIAELGIGTNPKAKITGKVLEDEKVMGTCHIALGNNYSFGGKVNVPIHLDGIIKKPTIYVDDKMIINDGKFLI